jgi:hypothetical protein
VHPVWRDRRTPLVVLLVASVAFRWPALINAATVNSDAAIVGLQAMHILRGEWAWFLFGSGYQTSVDSAVAAAFFAVLGATPLALVLSTFGGHLVATGLTYSTLSRHVPPWTAAIATLPLVFTPSPLHTYILGPPRQAAITLVFLAVWVLDRASATRAPRAWILAGAALASLACFADPYALLFLPPLVGLAVLAAFDLTPGPSAGGRGVIGHRVLAAVAGAVVGLVPFLLLTSSPKAAHGEATFRAATLAHNYRLLVDPCLPWVLSATAYVPSDPDYVPWRAGAFRLVQVAGATALLAGIAYGAVAFVRRRGDWPLRRLGAFGFAVLPLTLAAFLVSVMVMDLFSTRYLAAIVLMSPFALAPAAGRLATARFGAALAPYLIAAAVAGWLGFGADVAGYRPVHLPGGGALDEERLERLLRERGVEHAVADYWVAYRLTFLFDEAVEVVPIHAAEDRYAPYREAFDRAHRVAYVFDAQRSREKLAAMLEEPEGAQRYGTMGETLVVGNLTAVVLDRPPRVDAAPPAQKP